ncbi:MAG: hypothetical protein ABIJ46_00545 [bacterium]
MNEPWTGYRRTLNGEMGPELAEEFVGRLHDAAGGDPTRATNFFFGLGQLWSPLVQAWSRWVETNSTARVAVVLRDAKPLLARPTPSEWLRLHLNRLLCGVPDELSAHAGHAGHPLLAEYLDQRIGPDGEFTFADSGCYGTVLLQLHRQGIRPQPLFFFSKNPHVRGLLNEAGLSPEEGELLNDSLECGFPHVCGRPSELVRGPDETIRVRPTSTDPLSVRFGEAALAGVRQAPPSALPVREAAAALLSAAERARRGEFTGLLGRTSPEWSGKENFLASWPTELHWT